MMQRALTGSESWVGSMFDRGTLNEIIDNACRSSRDGNRLWLLYVLELWAARWL
jgi:hypothetical protein